DGADRDRRRGDPHQYSPAPGNLQPQRLQGRRHRHPLPREEARPLSPAPGAADWLQVSATVARDQAAPAEESLLAAGALAVTLQDAADRPVLEPAPGEMPLWPSLVITGLFAGDAEPLAVLAALHERMPGVHWRVASLAERAWEREWLRDFRPLRFGTRLAVVPVGMTPPAGTVVLRLDPGLAFGTGTHA